MTVKVVNIQNICMIIVIDVNICKLLKLMLTFVLVTIIDIKYLYQLYIDVINFLQSTPSQVAGSK